MNECSTARLRIAKEFEECRKAIIAIGDETRQSIIITLLQNESAGMRVGEITNRTHLSDLLYHIVCKYSRMQKLWQCGAKEQ